MTPCHNKELLFRQDLPGACRGHTVNLPGNQPSTVSHCVHAGTPADAARAAEYNEGPYAGVPEEALKGLASLEPADADVRTVADAIVRVVDMPFGKRLFRTHIDPSQDGAEIVNGVADHVRAEMFRPIGLEDLLSPRVSSGEIKQRA